MHTLMLPMQTPLVDCVSLKLVGTRKRPTHLRVGGSSKIGRNKCLHFRGRAHTKHAYLIVKPPDYILLLLITSAQTRWRQFGAVVPYTALVASTFLPFDPPSLKPCCNKRTNKNMCICPGNAKAYLEMNELRPVPACVRTFSPGLVPLLAAECLRLHMVQMGAIVMTASEQGHRQMAEVNSPRDALCRLTCVSTLGSLQDRPSLFRKYPSPLRHGLTFQVDPDVKNPRESTNSEQGRIW